MARSFIVRMGAAALGLLAGVLGAEMVFGPMRADGRPDSPVLYSLEVRSPEGELLASPMLVGEEGQKLHLDLAPGPHSEPLDLLAPHSGQLAMSLDLDPRPDEGGGLCLGFKLSLDKGSAQEGRLAMEYGQKKQFRLSRNGREIRLSLTVAKAHTREFGDILRHRRPAAS